MNMQLIECVDPPRYLNILEMGVPIGTTINRLKIGSFMTLVTTRDKQPIIVEYAASSIVSVNYRMEMHIR